MSTESGNTSPSLVSLQDQLAALIETFIHLGVQVHDAQGTTESQLGLAHHINRTIQELQQVAQTPSDAIIPADVVSYIDDGRNPDVYTREFVEVVRKLSQHSAGKVAALKHFELVLRKAIVQEWGDDMEL